MIASVPWSPLWQGLLNGIGWILAKLYQLIPNYGVTIILLTVAIRVVLLPLGIKQIKSMQAMQAIQPKVKAIQQKYKGNKQKVQEETMALYKEYGVNPFSGCWPMLLQFPILIAMYSVLRQPSDPPHLPANSSLQTQISKQIPLPPAPSPKEAPTPHGTTFVGANLLCSAIQSGRPAELKDRSTGQVYPVDCGTGVVPRIPFYVFAVLMFATTWYQQQQMQKASPPGSSSQQQQMLMKLMPLMFGFFGFTFPAGLVLYWTTSNVWQIGQQSLMLRARPTEPTPPAPSKKPARKGFMATMMDRAEEQRKRREGTAKPGPKPGPKAGGPKPGGAKPGGSKPGPKQGPGSPKKPGSGGSGGGNRKKRPKR